MLFASCELVAAAADCQVVAASAACAVFVPEPVGETSPGEGSP